MMRQNLRAFFALALLGLFASCASESTKPEEAPESTPQGMISAVGLQATEDGKPIDAHQRVWYGVRLAENPADAEGDRDYTVDAFTKDAYAALRDETDGMPEQEGRQFIVKDGRRLWLSCAFEHDETRDASWCLVPVPSICADHACMYDLHVANDALSDGLNDTKDWDEDPSAWTSTAFDWMSEFGDARLYVANYKEDMLKYADEDPSIELAVDGDKVTARGWIRRVYEDLDVTIEPRVPATRD